MKPAASSLTLSFLLFAFFITKLPLAFSNADVEPVLDVEGNTILPGGKYYILPAIWGPTGGGVKLGQTGDMTCPVTVLQAYSPLENGIPVTFRIHYDVEPAGTISTYTPLDIVFNFTEMPNCAESPNWLVFFDNDIKKACVGIGGPGNYPGQQALLSGTFNIQKYRVGYKLVFCFSGSFTCLDIGRYDDKSEEGGRRLILTKGDEAFDLVLIPADYIRGTNIIRSVA